MQRYQDEKAQWGKKDKTTGMGNKYKTWTVPLQI